ncbi:MAG TPA: hypothetical protein VLH19_05590 [Patescibacteria group bacterium]|nr:hypothetical protein [Patescibacteria group bacterium]
MPGKETEYPILSNAPVGTASKEDLQEEHRRFSEKHEEKLADLSVRDAEKKARE